MIFKLSVEKDLKRTTHCRGWDSDPAVGIPDPAVGIPDPAVGGSKFLGEAI